MRVGLVDVDSTGYPNLVLMKMAAWYKKQGHDVQLLKPEDVLKGSSLFCKYDELYGACVFDWNRPIADKLSDMGVYVAGTGTLDKNTLKDEVEHIMPDYSLYGIADCSFGFLTRGCPRQCPFCIVTGKEGTTSRKVANLSEFWDGQKEIKIMDPNILACPDHMDLLQQLADSKARVDFNQGLDARLLTKENIAILNTIKIKRIHFAWDNPKDKRIPAALSSFLKHTKIKDKQRKVVYVLTNYWSTHEEDLYRVYWLRDNGYDPYVMIYDKANAPKITKDLARWVNNRRIFKTVKRFEDYDPQKR